MTEQNGTLPSDDLQNEPHVTLTMKQGTISVERYLTLDEAEALGTDLLKYVTELREREIDPESIMVDTD